MADYPRPEYGVKHGETWGITAIHWGYRLTNLSVSLRQRGGTMAIRENFTPESDYYRYLTKGEVVARNQHMMYEEPIAFLRRS